MADIKVGETVKKAAGVGKKFFDEFKKFISRGNVIDLSIGVLIGGAFSGLVTAFTDDIINPILGLLGGSEAKFGWSIPLGSGEGQSLLIGAFVSSIINFLIMALVIFLIMKVLNKLLSLGKKEEEEKPAEPPKPSDEVVLLTEIRDLLKTKDGE
ncbi:MAG: large conductance mechanosensitive channel protein MscL [Solobacterium sp.]|nr:large conductance mechanosensitive channel protein MscL [Solobacterium sp.]